jgi:hypothetical protein
MIGGSTLLGTVSTYCTYCESKVIPSGGQETVSLVNTASGAIYGTWSTGASVATDVIQWTVTSANFTWSLSLDATATAWTGPASIGIPTSASIIGAVGIRGSFSGAPNLASSSVVSPVNL